jgi:hypothetical protein
MSSQTKIIKDILFSYETILENKKFITESIEYVKLEDTNYSNVNHDNDGTQNDSVNKSLLDDIQSAAKSVGITATITTAKTGHNTRTTTGNISTHTTGNGVDIAKLNGIGSNGATNGTTGIAKFRELGNKLKDALVSMGYTWNKEVNQPKAVLWQTNTGGNHFNHLHVSNRTGETSGKPTSSTSNTNTTSGKPTSSTSNTNTTSNTTSDEEQGKTGEFARQIGKSLLNAIGINESKFYFSLGKNQTLKGGEIILPKDSNSTVKSPVDGVISYTSQRGNCNNPLRLKVILDNETLYLSYCGLESTGLRIGDRVSRGDILGKSGSDVRVTLTTLKGDRQYIDTNKETNDKTITKPYYDDSTNEYSKLLRKGYHDLKKNLFKDTNKEKNDKKITKPYSDDSTNEYSKLLRKGYHDLKNNLFKINSPKKLEENIDRIKGLLK